MDYELMEEILSILESNQVDTDDEDEESEHPVNG